MDIVFATDGKNTFIVLLSKYFRKPGNSKKLSRRILRKEALRIESGWI
jgi:hypothetical protein